MSRPAPLASFLCLLLGVIMGMSACAPLPPRETEAAHPLAGRIWSAGEQRFVTPAELLDHMAGARFVLLGEIHDNPRHHELQAWAVAALGERNRRLALVAEMIAADQGPGLALFQAEPRTRAARLETFIHWADSGWPDFGLYEPIFDAALRAGFPLVAGNLDRAVVPAMHRAGLRALLEAERQRLDLIKGVPVDIATKLGRRIADAHCGIFAPEKASADKLANFVAIQYARDAYMAQAMRDGQGEDGAILIAGAEHVRRATGVPHHLARFKTRGPIVSVALMEVDYNRQEPGLYDADADYVWFTGGFGRGDPCAGLNP